jgi:hypothetical protein
MAVETWYIRNILVATGPTRNRIFWDNSPDAAVSETTTVTGWTVAKLVANNYSLLLNGTERASGTFSTTVAPDNTAPVSDETFDTAVFTPPPLIISSQCIATLYEYNGYFPAGDWTFAFPLIAVSNGGTQDGRVSMRVFKALRDPDNSTQWIGVTELTTDRLSGTEIVNLTTSASQTSTVTWSAPAFFLDNEFLLVKMAWQITGQANNNNADVLFRAGSTATMVSPNFRARVYNIN